MTIEKLKIITFALNFYWLRCLRWLSLVRERKLLFEWVSNALFLHLQVLHEFSFWREKHCARTYQRLVSRKHLREMFCLIASLSRLYPTDLAVDVFSW